MQRERVGWDGFDGRRRKAADLNGEIRLTGTGNLEGFDVTRRPWGFSGKRQFPDTGPG